MVLFLYLFLLCSITCRRFTSRFRKWGYWKTERHTQAYNQAAKTARISTWQTDRVNNMRPAVRRWAPGLFPSDRLEEEGTRWILTSASSPERPHGGGDTSSMLMLGCKLSMWWMGQSFMKTPCDCDTVVPCSHLSQRNSSPTGFMYLVSPPLWC